MRLFAKTQPWPRKKLISVWRSLKESSTNNRNKCNEYQQDIKQPHEALRSIHREMSILRCQIDTTLRVRSVELKSLMPDWFGKKNGPSWRTWSFLARDFVGAVRTVRKQAMKKAENRKQPIAATNLQHDFGVTNEVVQELHHFLISRTEGEALEVVRVAERETRSGTMAKTSCIV